MKEKPFILLTTLRTNDRLKMSDTSRIVESIGGAISISKQKNLVHMMEGSSVFITNDGFTFFSTIN